MFSSPQSNNLINKVHERPLRLITNAANRSFESLLQNNKDITDHQRNLQILITWFIELYLWVSLPEECKHQNSVGKFKEKIKKWKCEERTKEEHVLLERETVNFEFYLAIYKARNARTTNRMRAMFTRISGNLLEDCGKCYQFNILGKVRKGPGQCLRRFRKYSRRFRGIVKKIPKNVIKDSGECY